MISNDKLQKINNDYLQVAKEIETTDNLKLYDKFIRILKLLENKYIKEFLYIDEEFSYWLITSNMAITTYTYKKIDDKFIICLDVYCWNNKIVDEIINNENINIIGNPWIDGNNTHMFTIDLLSINELLKYNTYISNSQIKKQWLIHKEEKIGGQLKKC